MYYQTGAGNIVVFRGSPHQRGHGIGSFLKGLFRASLPVLKRGAQMLGKELFQSGADFMGDLEQNIAPKEAFEGRFNDFKQNMKRKALDAVLRGKGYKAKKKRKSPQSKRSSRKNKTSVKKGRRGKAKRGKKVKRSKKAGKAKRSKKVIRSKADIFGV